MKILIIDPLFETDTEIEREAAGADTELTFVMSRNGLIDDDSIYADADGLLNMRSMHKVPAATIAKLKRCRAIQQGGVGYNHIDLVAAAKRGIAVMNTPNYGTTEVANHAVALALNLLRGVQVYDRRLRRSNASWDAREIKCVRRTVGLRCGIIGLGRIGTATALRAKALGFRVIFHDPYLPNGADKAVGIARVRTLDELLAQTDVLSVHCPLNTETRHLIGSREIALLKPGTFVVNTARGAIIEKTAILAALREGRLAGAGLDVIEDEPLRSLEEAATPNLIATCHAAFCSVESKIEMRGTSARIALAAVTGQKLENVVNGLA